MNPLASYHPGNSWLHRRSAAFKLAALAAISILAVIWRNPWTTTALITVASAGFIMSGIGWRPLWQAMRRLLIIIVAVGAYQAWQQGWQAAYTIVGNVVGLVLLAGLLTAVTPVDDVLDTITGWLRPLRRFGVRPDWVALAFSLMIRAIPETMAIGRETRHAALARGLGRSPRAHLGPLVIRSVAKARTTGEALHARCLLDDDELAEH